MALCVLSSDNDDDDVAGERSARPLRSSLRDLRSPLFLRSARFMLMWFDPKMYNEADDTGEAQKGGLAGRGTVKDFSSGEGGSSWRLLEAILGDLG